MTESDLMIFRDKLNELNFDDLSILKLLIQSILNQKFKDLNSGKLTKKKFGEIK